MYLKLIHEYENVKKVKLGRYKRGLSVGRWIMFSRND